MSTVATPHRPAPPLRWLGLVVAVVVAASAGLVGNLLQGSDVAGQYLALERPVWAPPSNVFGLVWPVLYLLIGVAAWRVWDVAGGLRPAAMPLGLWGAQLVLNAAWPGAFFGAEAYDAAIVVIAMLVATVVATIAAFARHDRLAAVLLVPYLLWIAYATALNVAIWALN